MYETEEEIVQNLRDADCDEQTIRCFLSAWRSGCLDKGCLARHRRQLLERIHDGQKCLDCLDYLLYQMERAQKPPAHPRKETLP